MKSWGILFSTKQCRATTPGVFERHSFVLSIEVAPKSWQITQWMTFKMIQNDSKWFTEFQRHPVISSFGPCCNAGPRILQAASSRFLLGRWADRRRCLQVGLQVAMDGGPSPRWRWVDESQPRDVWGVPFMAACCDTITTLPQTQEIGSSRIYRIYRMDG